MATGIGPRTLLVSGGLAWLTLCGWAPADAAASPPVRSLAEIRHEGVVMQKWDLSCGAASLATLLTHDLSDPVSEREIATAMLRLATPLKVRTRGGFSLLDMQRYVETRGYAADGYARLTFEDLSTMLPAVVPVQFHGYDHFVVAREVRDGRVHLADPAYGRRAISVAEFEKAWKTKIAFVVSPGRYAR